MLNFLKFRLSHTDLHKILEVEGKNLRWYGFRWTQAIEIMPQKVRQHGQTLFLTDKNRPCSKTSCVINSTTNAKMKSVTKHHQLFMQMPAWSHINHAPNHVNQSRPLYRHPNIAPLIAPMMHLPPYTPIYLTLKDKCRGACINHYYYGWAGLVITNVYIH